MTNQFPVVKNTRTIIVTSEYSNTLIGRGLTAIQTQNKVLSVTDQDAQYRQVRDKYYRITKYVGHHIEDEDYKYYITEEAYRISFRLKELQTCIFEFLNLADQNYGRAYFPLSIIFKYGQGVTENILKAKHYAQLAFDWCFDNQFLEDSLIWNDLGMLYQLNEFVDTDESLSFFWFKKSAEKNNALAQYNLGRLFEFGRGVKQNKEKAFYWYRKAAKQGNLTAQYKLGCLFDFGIGVKEKFETALYWYRKSAKQGNLAAQYMLGGIFINKSVRVKRDKKIAVYWYLKAANQGYLNAQIELGFLYRDGVSLEEGISGKIYDLHLEKDLKRAIYWFSKAAEQGNEFSHQQIQELLHKQEAVQKHRQLTEELKEFGIDRKAT